MVLPPEYAWIGLVLIVAVAVFVADLIGNMISFKNRVMKCINNRRRVGGSIWVAGLFFIWHCDADELGICGNA